MASRLAVVSAFEVGKFLMVQVDQLFVDELTSKHIVAPQFHASSDGNVRSDERERDALFARRGERRPGLSDCPACE